MMHCRFSEKAATDKWEESVLDPDLMVDDDGEVCVKVKKTIEISSSDKLSNSKST